MNDILVAVGPTNTSGKLIYSPTAPVTPEFSGAYQLSPAIRVSNGRGEPIILTNVTVKMDRHSDLSFDYFRVSADGSTLLPSLTVDPNETVWVPLQYQVGLSPAKTHNILLPDPPPHEVRFYISFSGESSPLEITAQLAPYESASERRGHYFWGRTAELGEREFWSGHTSGQGSHHRSGSRFAYDAGITRYNEDSGQWEGLYDPSAGLGENENWICYGRNVYSVSDGTVYSSNDYQLPPGAEERSSPVTWLTVETHHDGKIELIRYLHLIPGSIPREFGVAGAEVKIGDFIGKVGAAGAPGGPHLHIDIVDVNKQHPLPLQFHNAMISDRGDDPERWLGRHGRGWVDCKGRGLPVATNGECRVLEVYARPEAIAIDQGRLNVFATNRDGEMVEKHWAGTTWSGWKVREGRLTSPCSAVSWAPNRLDLFATNWNGNLVHKYWNGASWSPWNTHVGLLTTPPGAVSWGVGRIDVFATNKEGQLVNKYWSNSTAKWSDWKIHSGLLTSPVSPIAQAKGRLDVFATNSSGNLVHKYWSDSNGEWSGWDTHLGVLSSTPSVLSRNPNRLDVFATNGRRHLVHKRWDGHAWSGWSEHAGVLSSPPAVLTRGNDGVDVLSTDRFGQMVHKHWNGEEWSDWNAHEGRLTSELTVTSWGQSRLDVFATDREGRLVHKYWNGDWSGWHAHEGLLG